jgi:FkbM family methyltransferase
MKSLLRKAVRYGALNLGPVSEAIYRTATRYVRHYKNFNYDPETNGEYHLLASVPQVRIAFDVGANRGEWSIACATRRQGATVHAFELVPNTFATLKKNTANYSAIVANPFGLSDAAGEVEVQVHPDPNVDYLSSMFGGSQHIHRTEFVTTRGRVETGDDYCARNGIAQIDFLKIDVEGAEGHVLRGFREMLAANRIAVIQFEYGQQNIFSRFMLLDFYEMLSGLGYSVGKLFPRGVHFRPWRPTDEDFLGPNFVAVADRFEDVRARISLR